MINNANLQINIAGNVFAQIEKLQANFAEVVNVVERLDGSVNQTVTNIGRQFNNLNINAAIDKFRNYSELISSTSAPGIGFEKSVADLSAITGIAGKELDDLEQRARQVGVSSGLGAAGAAEAYKLLASQIQVDKIGIAGLNELHKETITLAQASGMSMADAANSMAGTINQFGLEASEANRVINVLAAGSKYGAAEIPELAQSFKVVGAAANAAGLNIEQTAGAIEVLSKNNLKGAEAGTSLRNIVLKMQTALGVDFKEVPLSDALEALKPQLSDATYLSKLFGMENVAAAQFLISNAGAVKEMTEQLTGTNVAQEQAAITTETTAFKMQQWRAAIDDVKIGMFDLMGSSAGFLTVAGEQMVLVAQMMPILKMLGSTFMWFTKVQNLQKIATIGLNVVNGIWTGIQWALNAALWACPLTWIIAAILALVGVIVYLCTCVEGWGAQWDSIVNFAKNCWDLFVETLKFGWNSTVDSIMIGLNYIKLGWYKFKEAVGLGDSSDNQSAIAEINANIEARKQAIVDGAKKVSELGAKTAGSLTWELSIKKDSTESVTDPVPQIPQPAAPVAQMQNATSVATPAAVNLDFNKTNSSGSGSKSQSVDLDKMAPKDMKGSTAYNAIVSKLAAIKMPSIAAAAASLAIPITVATTTPELPKPIDPPTIGIQNGDTPSAYNRLSALNMPSIAAGGTPMVTTPKMPTLAEVPRVENLNRSNLDTKDYSRQSSGRNINVKACDKIEIHIDKADSKGYAEIEKQVNRIAQKAAIETINKILDSEA